MTDEPVRSISHTSWCEPAYNDWETIDKLRFNPQDPWIQFSIGVYRALLEAWDEDFLILPYLYRSPLDAANGIRGTRLFTDLYDSPDRVKQLIDWCADWSIQLEAYIKESVEAPASWGRGVWLTWLPEGAVFANGDPIDLVKREFQPIFDRPYSEKLFTTLGGGFFHHRALGLYQVDQVAATKGLLVQQIYDDPNVASVAETIIGDPAMQDKVLEASLKAPIMLDDFSPALLDRLLPIISDGRFILKPLIQDKEEGRQVVRQVRAFSNIG
jgi:hypothetical protein